MATKVFTPDGRAVFTKEMRKEYTILMPMMLPIHFQLLEAVFSQHGYHMELLDTTGQQIIDEGLQDVHNDTCYPALLVIGQLLNAVKSGKYDLDKIALIITQTGGGCRASNYIHLLRKALKRNGLESIPVVSLNLMGMEKNPGFTVTLPMLLHMGFCIIYGDLLMLLSNQTRPYEIKKGETDALVQTWIKRLLTKKGALVGKGFTNNLQLIVQDFAAIERQNTPKIRVGIVGEIYIKYARLGNNNLEEFLANEGTEVVVPGLLDYLMYSSSNPYTDFKLYGKGIFKGLGAQFLLKGMMALQKKMITAVEKYSDFRPPVAFDHVRSLIEGVIHPGVKMGEGWLLTAEMIELITSGTPNVICTQPFGCLPNHIVGKGMIRKIREIYPDSNIVAIDYDPGATKINQENRIKLMLANARLQLERQLEGKSAAEEKEFSPVHAQI